MSEGDEVHGPLEGPSLLLYLYRFAQTNDDAQAGQFLRLPVPGIFSMH